MTKKNMMNNITLTTLCASLLLFAFLVPLAVFAHETHIYEINGVEYEIVIGSLGEPVIVDDKTGFSLEIVRGGQLLVGAQDMLQLELLAGERSLTQELSPVHGAEGMYKTNFIATVPTTIQYRLFGELEGVPFDQTYTCNPAGHPQSEENTERIDISEGVIQTLSRGNFGCPQPKEEFGFPEPAASAVSLEREIVAASAERMTDVSEKTDRKSGKNAVAFGALALSLIAVILALVAMRQSRRENEMIITGKK
jgi:hypothetical protein